MKLEATGQTNSEVLQIVLKEMEDCGLVRFQTNDMDDRKHISHQTPGKPVEQDTVGRNRMATASML